MNPFNLQTIIVEMWTRFLDQLPNLVLILVIFIMGCLLAIWLGHLTSRLLRKIHIDQLFQKNSWKRGLEQSGIKSNLSDMGGWIVRWLLILLFLSMAAEALSLPSIANFIMAIVRWLPNLLIAMLIFIVATILADAAGNIIRISINWIDASYAFVAEKFARWGIWGLAILVILRQIGIVPEMTTILFQGLIYFLVLAFGLAFGLGGQEVAKDFLKNLGNKIKKEEK